MKYLKRFETEIIRKKYNKGDFVVLDLDKIKYHNSIDGYKDNDPIPESKYVEIIELLNSDDDFQTYIVLSHDNKEFYINKLEIERFMTIDEIKEYTIKKDTNKFNI